MLTFAGREYRPFVDELVVLADQLERRGQPFPGARLYRGVDDLTFGPLADRIREAVEPPVSAVALEEHEAAAIVLASLDVDSDELARFRAHYLAEHEWTRRPLSQLLETSRSVQDCFARKIGQWFVDEGLEAPIGGIDEETGEDLAPRGVDFAALAAMNGAFADAASTWARLTGSTIADPRVVADEMLGWLRQERSDAEEVAAGEGVEQAKAWARAWALREATLWLETCANRARLPWEPPRHEA
ncbi:MAG: hypothetical protein ACRDNG_04200 [Gaiellaceae bacterium]